MNELMTILAEECAEVTVAASKIIRFGDDDKNRERLSEEVGDLMCMVDLLYEYGVINPGSVHKQIAAKREKLRIYSNLIRD